MVETKPTKLSQFNKGAKRNSESLGMCFSVIGVWLLNDVVKAEIPMEVMGALFTAVGIISGRLRDSIF